MHKKIDKVENPKFFQSENRRELREIIVPLPPSLSPFPRIIFFEREKGERKKKGGGNS